MQGVNVEGKEVSFVQADGNGLMRAGLLQTCLALRMSLNGAADRWPRDEFDACVAILQTRYDHWATLSRGEDADELAFDAAVLSLLEATLAIAKRGPIGGW